MKKSYLASLLIVSHSLFASSLTPIAESTCQGAYKELFSRDEIRMTIALGYFDIGEGRTQDLAGLTHYLNTFTSRCAKWDQKMCGFTLVSSSPFVLTRKIFGPDGNEKLLKIIIDASSVSYDDAANRSSPEQKKQTSKMRSLFRDGLENSEVTFYHGHSRDGGGPSFGPPVLRANGHVDYEYYKANPADKKFLLSVLAKSPEKSRLVALGSCSSLRWFSKEISQQAPSSGIIGTDASFTTRYFEESLVFMENIFSFKCLKDLKVKDALSKGQLISGKEYPASPRSRLLSPQQLDQQTLEALATHLSSRNLSTRKNAYLEIKSYEERSYSPRVRQELANYTFRNTFFNNL